jgi:PAS domain S-box-containing protein
MGNGVQTEPTERDGDPRVMQASEPLTSLAASAPRLLLALDGARTDAFEWDFARDRVCSAGTIGRELGIPAEESTASYLERVHPDDRHRLSLALTRLSPDRAHYTLAYRVRRDGSEAYVTVVDSGRAHFETTGSRSHIMGVRRRLDEDDTESAASPQEGGERCRILLHAVPTITLAFDSDGSNTFASEQWCAYTGMTPAQALAQGWKQAMHPDDLARATANWTKATQDRHPFEMRHRIRRADGSYRWFLLQAKLHRDAHDRNDEWVVGLTDIEELQESVEGLRASQTKLTADLAAMTLLQQLGTLILRDGNPEPLLHMIIDVAMRISGAQFVTIQVVDGESGILQNVAQRGFPEGWIDLWNTDSVSAEVGGTVVTQGEHVIVADVERSPMFVGTPALDALCKVGVRALESTPLISRSGKVVGILSTFHRTEWHPDQNALRLLDIVARQAADFIERQEVESALRKGDERLRFAMKATHTGTWEIDLAHNTVQRSLEHDRIFGYTELLPEWPYERCLAHVLPEDRAAVDAAIRDAAASVTDLSFECRIRRVDGEIRWILAAGRHRKDRAGNPRWIAGIVRDITGRKQAEEAARQNQRLLQLFIEHAPAALAMFDRDMRYVAASARWRGDYRLGPDVIGRSHYHVFPNIPERWKEVHRRAMAGEVLRANDDCFERVDGTRQWLMWEVRPWFAANGEVGGILIFSENITDVKRAEQALRESDERFQLASEIGRSGTWDWNMASGELVWSHGKFRNLGYALNEVAPSYAAWADRVHPDDLPRVEAEVARSIAEHSDYSCNYRIVWPDKSVHWMTARARYEYDDKGVCRRMVGIMADVTELMETERELQDMNARLSNLVAERTRLADERATYLRELAAELICAEHRERTRLYEVIHDHVQPLLVGARLALSGLNQHTKVDTWVSTAADACANITKALDTARSLGVELNPPVVRERGLGPAMEHLCAWARTYHRLHVDLKCDPAAEPDDVATRLLLFKATRELLLNVAKHAGVNQVKITMERTAELATQITVSDDGAGFDSAARGRPLGDNGCFGLWNIEQRLGMIGGRIEVESELGAGTTVRLLVPPLPASAHA